MFYFNQFTTYFWLSNLLMTPISFIVVISGMILLMVSWIPYVNVVVGYLVWGAVYVMNTFVSWVERLPFSIVKGLYVSEFEFVMLLLAFVLLLLTVARQSKRMLIATLSAVLLLMVSVTVRLYQTDAQKGVTVFSLRNHTAVDFVRGGEHLLLADSTLMADESTVNYSLKGAWAKRHLSANPQVVSLDEAFEGAYLRKRQNLVSFDGKLLALWDGSCFADSLTYRLPTDYVLVTGKQKADVQSVVNGYEVKTLLIDGSVPRYLAEQWIAQAEEKGIAYSNIGEGAFEVVF